MFSDMRRPGDSNRRLSVPKHLPALGLERGFNWCDSITLVALIAEKDIRHVPELESIRRAIARDLLITGLLVKNFGPTGKQRQ